MAGSGERSGRVASPSRHSARAAARTAPRAPVAAAARVTWLPFAALAVLAVVLYGRGFGVGFVGDDYTLLDAALRVPLLELLSGRHGIVGYYRPISRELYFWTWGHLAGAAPFPYHLVNTLTYTAVVAMFYRLLARWQGVRVATLGALAFMLFPPTGALLSWISCAQDLIALFWGVAALLLYAEERRVTAGIAVALATLSKETAVMAAPALIAWEACAGEPAAARERVRRLLPVVLGVVAAVAIAVLVRTTWPAGTSVAVWSPRQMAGAWRLPVHFASTFLPPDSWAGAMHAARAWTPLLVLAALLAPLAVPSRHAREPAGQGGLRVRGIVFGVVLAVLGMAPVAVILDRWRGYFFSFAALGTSVLVGIALAAPTPWIARTLAVVLAVVSFGANSVYRPISTASGPARHPHVNYAFFRENADLTRSLLAPLELQCPSFRRLPRIFTIGAPPGDVLFESIVGAGLRVTCRDTVARVRPLDQFEPADAEHEFGLLRFDPSALAITFEDGDATARRRLGEGFLLAGRYDAAAACYASAGTETTADPDVHYLVALALAAGGRPGRARRAWQDDVATRTAASPEAMAARWLPSASARGLRPELREVMAAALRDPADAAAHAALGQRLLQEGNTRRGALELSAAYGISGQPADLIALADAYLTMGAVNEARDAYRRALEQVPPPELRDHASAAIARIDAVRTVDVKTGR